MGANASFDAAVECQNDTSGAQIEAWTPQHRSALVRFLFAMACPGSARIALDPRGAVA